VSTDNSLLGWVLAGVSAMIATLTGGLSWMYKKQVADYEKNEELLRNEAERYRLEVVAERARLEVKLEKMEEKVNDCQTTHMQGEIELARINERLRLLELYQLKHPFPEKTE
jgi:hypothetical protein